LNYESFSYTCAQAMAAGIPLVATNIGGIPETLGEHSGILVPMGDIAALVEALGKLIVDPTLRKTFGEYGQQRVKFFDSNVVAQKTLTVYQELLMQQGDQL